MSANLLSRLNTSNISVISTDYSVKLSHELRAFACLERWTKATSEDAGVTDIIKRAQRQGTRFNKALITSSLVAQAILSISRNIATLCESLLDEAAQTKDIQEYIQYLHEASTSGRRNSEYVTRKFRDIRRDLLQITNLIPVELSRLESEQNDASTKKASHERRRDRAKFTNIVSTAGSACVGAAIAIGLACPPAILVLPIMLPVIALLGQGVESHYSKKITARETKIYECKEALAELATVAEDISKLEIFVDKTIDWWTGIEAELKSLETSAHGISAMRKNKILLKAIQKQSEALQESQLEYIKKIQLLQDFYPASTKSERPSIKQSNSDGGNGSKERKPTITRSAHVVQASQSRTTAITKKYRRS